MSTAADTPPDGVDSSRESTALTVSESETVTTRSEVEAPAGHRYGVMDGRGGQWLVEACDKYPEPSPIGLVDDLLVSPARHAADIAAAKAAGAAQVTARIEATLASWPVHGDVPLGAITEYRIAVTQCANAIRAALTTGGEG